MEIFRIALLNVVVTLACIVPGFVMRKAGKAHTEHLPTLSGILVYLCTPFLEFNSFISLEFDPVQLRDMGIFLLVAVAVEMLFCGLIVLVSGRRRGEFPTRVVTLASMLGNVGYFGIPVMRALLPDEPLALCYAAMFIVGMNIITFTVGVYMLTGDKKHVSVRAALVNPATVGLAVSLPVYIFGLGKYFPPAVIQMIGNICNMTAPLCMFILGVRLASADLKKIFVRPQVFIAAALKLLAFPLLCYGIVMLLPVSHVFRFTLVVLAATPCASHVLNFSEIYHTDPDLAANCVLVSTVLCFLSIPFIALLPM